MLPKPNGRLFGIEAPGPSIGLAIAGDSDPPSGVLIAEGGTPVGGAAVTGGAETGIANLFVGFTP
jgi:hypothetical protein